MHPKLYATGGLVLGLALLLWLQVVTISQLIFGSIVCALWRSNAFHAVFAFFSANLSSSPKSNGDAPSPKKKEAAKTKGGTEPSRPAKRRKDAAKAEPKKEPTKKPPPPHAQRPTEAPPPAAPAPAAPPGFGDDASSGSDESDAAEADGHAAVRLRAGIIGSARISAGAVQHDDDVSARASAHDARARARARNTLAGGCVADGQPEGSACRWHGAPR